MGEVLRAVRWLASVGWGWCEGWRAGGGEVGTLWRVEGRGGIMMVPKGEKAAGVSECIGTRTGLDGETVGRVEGIVVVVWMLCVRRDGQRGVRQCLSLMSCALAPDSVSNVCMVSKDAVVLRTQWAVVSALALGAIQAVILARVFPFVVSA